MFKVVAILFLAVAVASAAGSTLRRTDGAPAELVLVGRPSILFYEDRGSHWWNQQLKDTLFEHGRARGLLDRVRVVAIANLSAYNFFPAREIATRYVRRIEAEVGLPILLDLDGVLARPPWSLPPDGAAVVLFDVRGERVRHWLGRLSPADIEAAIATLGQLVREDAQ